MESWGASRWVALALEGSKVLFGDSRGEGWNCYPICNKNLTLELLFWNISDSSFILKIFISLANQKLT